MRVSKSEIKIHFGLSIHLDMLRVRQLKLIRRVLTEEKETFIQFNVILSTIANKLYSDTF